MRRLRVTDYCPKLQKGRQKSGSALAGAATGTEAKVPFGALSTGLRATWGRVVRSRLTTRSRSPQLGQS